jgi:hypothetical protein
METTAKKRNGKQPKFPPFLKIGQFIINNNAWRWKLQHYYSPPSLNLRTATAKETKKKQDFFDFCGTTKI